MCLNVFNPPNAGNAKPTAKRRALQRSPLCSASSCCACFLPVSCAARRGWKIACCRDAPIVLLILEAGRCVELLLRGARQYQVIALRRELIPRHGHELAAHP